MTEPTHAATPRPAAARSQRISRWKIRKLAHDLSNALEIIVQTSYLLGTVELKEPGSDWLRMLDSGVRKALDINQSRAARVHRGPTLPSTSLRVARIAYFVFADFFCAGPSHFDSGPGSCAASLRAAQFSSPAFACVRQPRRRSSAAGLGATTVPLGDGERAQMRESFASCDRQQLLDLLQQDTGMHRLHQHLIGAQVDCQSSSAMGKAVSIAMAGW